MISGGALLAVLWLQSPTNAAGAASQASTKARLELRGAADCMSPSDLAARVAIRSARIQFVDDAVIDAQVVLTSTRPGNVVAELVLTAGGAAPTPRRIVARSCAEAADAIALIIAVTLDPTARRKVATGPAQDRSGADGDTAARAATNPSGAASGTTDTATAPVPGPAPKPATRPSPIEPRAPDIAREASAPPARAPAARSRRHFGAYVAGQTIFGPAPSVMPGVAVYGAAALDRDGVWAPALFVGATYVWRAGLPEPGGAASFSFGGGSVDACPLRFGWSSLVARPCATALVGRLTASGADTDQAARAARPFAAAGAAVSATLGSTVELSARLGIGLTLIRDSYQFGATTFHRADRLTTSASLGVGFRWP